MQQQNQHYRNTINVANVAETKSTLQQQKQLSNNRTVSRIVFVSHSFGWQICSCKSDLAVAPKSEPNRTYLTLPILLRTKIIFAAKN